MGDKLFYPAPIKRPLSDLPRAERRRIKRAVARGRVLADPRERELQRAASSEYPSWSYPAFTLGHSALAAYMWARYLSGAAWIDLWIPFVFTATALTWVAQWCAHASLRRRLALTEAADVNALRAAGPAIPDAPPHHDAR